MQSKGAPPHERHPSKLDEQARTWLLLAGLTALFIGIGCLLGGAFIWLFVVFSVSDERRGVLLVGQVRHPAAGAKPVSEEEAPELAQDVERAVASCARCRSRGST